MIFIEKLLARYGIIFFFGFLGSFILLITIVGKAEKPILFPADIHVVREGFTLYLPFGSAIALGLLATVGFEIYKFFKR